MLEETTNLNNYLQSAAWPHVCQEISNLKLWTSEDFSELEVHLGHSAALRPERFERRSGCGPFPVPLQSCIDWNSNDSMGYFKPRRDKMVKNKSALN